MKIWMYTRIYWGRKNWRHFVFFIHLEHATNKQTYKRQKKKGEKKAKIKRQTQMCFWKEQNVATCCRSERLNTHKKKTANKKCGEDPINAFIVLRIGWPIKKTTFILFWGILGYCGTIRKSMRKPYTGEDNISRLFMTSGEFDTHQKRENGNVFFFNPLWRRNFFFFFFSKTF